MISYVDFSWFRNPATEGASPVCKQRLLQQFPAQNDLPPSTLATAAATAAATAPSSSDGTPLTFEEVACGGTPNQAFLTALARSFFLDSSPDQPIPKSTEDVAREPGDDDDDDDVEVHLQEPAGPSCGRSASVMTIRSEALTTSDLNRSISSDHGYTLPPHHHPSPSTRAASRLSLARPPRSPSVDSVGHLASPARGVTQDAMKIEWSPDTARNSGSPSKQSARPFTSVAGPRPRTLHF